MSANSASPRDLENPSHPPGLVGDPGAFPSPPGVSLCSELVVRRLGAVPHWACIAARLHWLPGPRGEYRPGWGRAVDVSEDDERYSPGQGPELLMVLKRMAADEDDAAGAITQRQNIFRHPPPIFFGHTRYF